MCRRKGLKVNAGKSRVMLGGEEGLECEVLRERDTFSLCLGI